MKEKLYIVTCLLLLTAGVLFTSCSEENGVDPFVDPSEEEGGTGYLSINLVADPTLYTRATQYEAIYAWEHQVQSVWVLLYNTSGELEEKFEFGVTNFENGELVNFKDKTSQNKGVGKTGTNPKMQFTTVAKPVKRKTYKMVVLVNPEDVLSHYGLTISTTDAEGKKLSALTDKIWDISSLSGLNVFGGRRNMSTTPFFMSNANGVITVTSSDLQPTEDEALSKPVSVYVDRLLAKVVVVRPDNAPTLPANTRLEGFKWYLNVMNTKTFPIRKYAYYSNGTMEDESNSTIAQRQYMYSEDPNFNTNPGSDFVNIASGSEVWSTWKESNVDWEDASLPTYQYLLENTMSQTAQNANGAADYTTRIVVHANLIYTNFLSTPTGPTDPGRNYYSYESTSGVWKVFSHEQARFWMERGFPAEMVGLEAKIKAHISALELNPSALAFNFKQVTPSSTITTCVTYLGITYHPQGLNIYKIPIRHFTTASKGAYGYYGVVRNNIYSVAINSISGPGSGYVDPETAYISAKISITPWYRRDFQIVEPGKQ